MIRRLASVASLGAAPETYHVAPEKRVSGDPEQRLWSQYTDASGKFFTGVWESDPGDEFVIPRGFEGVWEVVERTRKTYVIYEANP